MLLLLIQIILPYANLDTLYILSNFKNHIKSKLVTLYKCDRIDLFRLNILLKDLEFKDSSVCFPQPIITRILYLWFYSRNLHTSQWKLLITRYKGASQVAQ